MFAFPLTFPFATAFAALSPWSVAAMDHLLFATQSTLLQTGAGLCLKIFLFAIALIVGIVCVLLFFSTGRRIMRHPFQCWSLAKAIDAAIETDFIPIPDLCDNVPVDANILQSSPGATPVVQGVWPASPTPRYQAILNWTQEHDFRFMGAFELSNHTQRTAFWLNFQNVTSITYTINSQGNEEILFTTEFVKDGTLYTSDALNQLLLPLPPHQWAQSFAFAPRKIPTVADNRHSSTFDRSRRETEFEYNGDSETPSHSTAVRVARDRIDSLYAIHQEGVRYLVDSHLETLLPPGAGTLENYWENKDLTLLAALESGDLTEIQQALRRAFKTDMQNQIRYIKSLPFWRIRINHWCTTRPGKLANKTIEEQIRKL